MRILLPAALFLLSASPIAAQDRWDAPTGNWSGSYVSGTIGFGRTASSTTGGGPTVSVSDTSGSFSIAAGHQVQTGAVVYGAEVGLFDVTGDLGAPGAALGVDYGLRANARVGYDLGESMVYGTVGLARAGFEGTGGPSDDNALAVGAGIDLKMTGQMKVGAEVMHYRFGDVPRAGGPGTTAKVNATTMGVKLSYGF